jgi:hypothetical protein
MPAITLAGGTPALPGDGVVGFAGCGQARSYKRLFAGGTPALPGAAKAGNKEPRGPDFHELVFDRSKNWRSLL